MTCPAHRAIAALTVMSLSLAGCNLAPSYERPAIVAVPPEFKELPGWHSAMPSDAVARGSWWQLFGDPVLNDLEARVLVSNQNLAAAEAAFDQARALVRQQRAALFPSVSLNGKATDEKAFGSSTTATSVSDNAGNAIQVSVGASWEPDLWTAIGNSVSQAKANAQASEGDLASATLSAQGELALDYLQMRGVEAQKVLLETTVAAYRRALDITTNRYNAGAAARLDVDQAETALHNAQAQAEDLDRQRALFEHAIAVLAGDYPSTFSLPPANWNATVPEIPSVVPSDLLERRPDIAAAERRVAAANANIGIQRAAAFPLIGLTAGVGTGANSLGTLFEATTSAWSLGLSAVFSLLDFGANKAKVAGARAGWEQTVAQYRQTVLGAFQQTEDQLATARVLRDVAAERKAAADSAIRAETIAHNQYLAGLIGYSDVITAQTSALGARVTDIQTTVNRQVAAVSLIEAIGGHWDAPQTARD